MSFIHPIKESDFDLMSKDGLVLKYDDVIILLFNDGSELGMILRKMMKKTLKLVVGPVFAECDLHAQDKVASTILKIGNIPSHPLAWLMQPFPYIAVYRGGWPQAFYNGELNIQKFAEYSSILAGQPTYHDTKYVLRQPVRSGASSGAPSQQGGVGGVGGVGGAGGSGQAPPRPSQQDRAGGSGQTAPRSETAKSGGSNYMQSPSQVRRITPV